MKKLENFIKQYFTQIITLSLLSSLYVALIDATVKIGQISFNPIKAFQMTMAYGGFSITNFLTILILIVIGIILIGYAVSNNKEETNEFGTKRERDKRAKTYGSAHFEEPDEFKDIADVAPAAEIEGTIYGEYVYPEESSQKNNKGYVLGRKPSYDIPNDHSMIFGSTGVGKSRTIVKNMIFQMVKNYESGVITDLKGELYEDMVPYFISHGYRVRMLNCKEFLKSDGFNILKYINIKRITEDIPRVTNTLIENFVLMYPDTGEAIYKEGAKMALNAIIALIMTCNSFVEDQPEGKFNLSDTKVEDLKNRIGQPIGTKSITTIIAIASHPDSKELLEFLFSDEHLNTMGGKIARDYYNSFLQGRDEFRRSILFNLNSYFNSLRNQTLQEILSTDNIHIEDLENRPTVFFCVTDSPIYRPITAMFFDSIITTLKSIADSRPSRCLYRKVNFILDEFPNIGILPNWSENMATIRSQGMVATMISQDIALLENRYGNTTSSIIANCATLVSLGINHMPTAELLASRVGTETVMVKTERRQRWDTMEHSFFSKAEKYSRTEAGVPLLTATEILNLSIKYNLVFFQGHNPIKCKKFPYTRHPEYKNMPRLNGEVYKRKILSLPDINTEERLKLMAQEDFYSDKYLKSHGIKIGFQEEHIEQIDEFKEIYTPLNIDCYDEIYNLTPVHPYSSIEEQSTNTCKPYRGVQ